MDQLMNYKDRNIRQVIENDMGQSQRRRPRLVLLISSLAMGGAERVVSLLANGWSNQDIELIVLTLAEPKTDFYSLPDNVNRVHLGLKGPSTNIPQAVITNIGRATTLRRAFRQLKPDAVISHLDAMNVLAILSGQGLNIPILVTEHTNLDMYQEFLPLPWRILRRFTYKKAAAVVAVSNNTSSQMSRYVPDDLLHVIPNPADPAGCQGEPSLNIEGPTIVSMGRLVESKGVDVLIKAFARSIEKNPEWSLLILGDGPERLKLESLAGELGIHDKCHFAGAVNNPGPVLAQAELFALASRFEGFPMSLVEAMVCGLPVVCTKYSSDTGEIVSDGEDGVLVDVDDESGMAEALAHLMSNDRLREQMSLKAKELTKRFSLKSIINQWNSLLTKTTGQQWPQ
jgi:GalNAc-alpha-(1->4)-GalNAc-alpha-(1->3)-diNAcBac-PP-undecaprenol alpha-1,4-N-acetyl-D-galactosaminyltransferase